MKRGLCGGRRIGRRLYVKTPADRYVELRRLIEQAAKGGPTE